MKHLELFVMAMVLACTACGPKPADYVNTLQGTKSEYGLSFGNTYPAVAQPWGQNFWVAQTRPNGNGWQYVYSDDTIYGFKQTHQPSPWINDYGCFSLMPVCGKLSVFPEDRKAFFDHSEEEAHPYYYGVMLSSGIFAELTPSYSGAIMRFTYPDGTDPYLIVDCFSHDGDVWADLDNSMLCGYSGFYAPNNNAVLPENFATHFHISLSAGISDFGVVKNDEGKYAWVKLDLPENRIVEAKVASSFVSADQACTNCKNELAAISFDKLKMKSYKEWNRTLGVFSIKGASKEQLHTFYSALYHASLFPRRLYDRDQEGNIIHYDFFNGDVKTGYMYSDNGFWDTFRSVHPLFTIIHPSLSSEFMDALLNVYKEGGWLPEWFAPAYKDCMVGQNSVSVVTDSYLKGIKSYDDSLMFEAFIKGANSIGPNATGRRGYEEYNALGYVPYDVGVKESVSRTLDYAYDDYCISLYADAIGKPDEAEKYRARALNYKNLFDSSVGFMRPKSSNGIWEEDWTPDTWGGSFTEGSSWHWTWCVYHDPKGLIDLFGSEDAFVSRLDSVFTCEPTFRSSYYSKVIHEMSEMVECGMGQYAHGNQPIQHMIYLYDYAGAPYKAQSHVREVMDKLYCSGLGTGAGYCGDEDNGQTSAWYIFSAMGFYPVCPGNSEYVIGSPLFGEISIKMENGRKFKVKAQNNSPENVYIQSAKLNGLPLERCYLRHDEIVNGGTLEFVMGPEPSDWGKSPESRPKSLSDE